MSPGASDVHPVIAAILERARTRSTPQHRSDTLRIALVVEGGAMRGVVSGGMLLGLEKLGLRDSFDAVYGTSAGAANAACFLAGQMALGVSHYYPEDNAFRVVDFSRPLRGKPVVDVDHLFGSLETGPFPLAFSELQRCGAQFVALAVEVQGQQHSLDPNPAARLRRLTNFQDLQDLMNGLRASAQIPVFSGPPVTYRGMHLLDGGLVQEIPVHAAIEDGYDHILPLATLPEGTSRSRIAQLFEKHYLAPRLQALDPVLAQSLLTRHGRYRVTQNFLRSKRYDRRGPPYVTLAELPRHGLRITAFETRRARLALGATAGANAVLRMFGCQKLIVPELL